MPGQIARQKHQAALLAACSDVPPPNEIRQECSRLLGARRPDRPGMWKRKMLGHTLSQGRQERGKHQRPAKSCAHSGFIAQ